MKYNDSYVFGRIGGIYSPGKYQLYVVYVYSNLSDSPEIIPQLNKNQILVEPCIINRLGFSRGFMRVVENRPIDDITGYPELSFSDGRYLYNEEDEIIKKPKGHVVQLSFGNYRTLDDEISRKLGIPLASDE